jgi:5-methylcytosine-specific restriction endonuclease McrA
MPTTNLDRVLFLQGGQCFFCAKMLSKAEASVEHLVPKAHGGNDHIDNLVACCTALNSFFGSMTPKEKIRAVLNQRGKFKCPNGQTPTTAAAT